MKTRFKFILIVTVAWAVGPSIAEPRERISLNGQWDFFPDVGDAPLETVLRDGVIKRGRIGVPGAWQAQGYGSPGGAIPSSVVGSDLTAAAYLRHNLTARCLYVRQVDVPRSWNSGRVFIRVARAYRYADVTVNGKRVGDYEGFSSPFEFDITEAVRFGRQNEMVLGVDNRQREGRDTVGCANYFTNTGGIGGDVLLESRSTDWIQSVFAIPRIADGQARLRVTLKSAGDVWPGGSEVAATVIPWDVDGKARQLKKDRHGPLIRGGKTAVLLLGTGGFAERRDGYFLNARGGAFGGIIEHHPVFAPIPHQGRLHLGIYQLIAGGGVLDAESMPAAFRNGAVVRGLGLTGWISTEKNLQRTIQFTDLTADNGLHLILCSLDLLSNKPESRYVLAGTMKYLLAGKPSPPAARCAAAELGILLR